MRSGKADRLTLGPAEMPVQDGLAALVASPSPRHSVRCKASHLPTEFPIKS